MSKHALDQIKAIYEKGENIIEYFKKETRQRKNTPEMIRISYDLQSGSYIKIAESKVQLIEKYTQDIARVINQLECKYSSLLEVGVGEATTLANVLPKLKAPPKMVYGFDLAWSRVRYALAYMLKKGIQDRHLLFMGDLFNIPIADNAIDIVYTAHSLEPNGGKEKEALLEVMRITKKYLILIEPAYEFANNLQKKRMEQLGYIKGLYALARKMGLNVIEHRLLDTHLNPLNPSGLIIIKKEVSGSEKAADSPLVCPITKLKLKLYKNTYFSEESLLAYPVIDGVPVLLEDYAVIAVHFLDNFRDI